jgi:hypothetical protein
MGLILKEAVNEIANLSAQDKINIRGKLYTPVDKRVQMFRKHFGEQGAIETEILHCDDTVVRILAKVSVTFEGQWHCIGTGCAEEYRQSGPVNKTSALENAETSAIGRALASCGLGGGEYASAFEVDNAVNNKPAAPNPADNLNTLAQKVQSVAELHSLWETNKEQLELLKESNKKAYDDLVKDFVSLRKKLENKEDL